MSRALQELASRGDHLKLARRLGQALWMQVAAPLDLPSLLWARGLLGPDGDALLWRALNEEGVLSGHRSSVQPEALSQFLCSLTGTAPTVEAELVWSVPPVIASSLALRSYAEAAISVIDGSLHTIVLVSPFLEPRGVGRLLSAIVSAIQRGVCVTIVTHEAQNVSSLAAQSLEDLRRESVTRNGSLAVYSASATAGVLIHSKIILVDREKVIIGSANITSRGLAENVEAGVVLGTRAASEVAAVVEALLVTGLVGLVFATGVS